MELLPRYIKDLTQAVEELTKEVREIKEKLGDKNEEPEA